MRIAVWHNLPSGGGKRALHSQVSQLLKRGHSVESWCPETADPDYLPIGELTTEHRLAFRSNAPVIRSRWQRFAKLGEPEPNSVLGEMDRHSEKCAEAILKGRFDLVFVSPCLFFRVPRIGRFLRNKGIPVILYLQEPQRWLYEAQPCLPWIANSEGGIRIKLTSKDSWREFINDYENIRQLRTAARREWEDARFYDRILVNSFFSRETVIRSLGLEASVSYLGYDETIFLDRDLAREDFVLGLGSMDSIKGVETAIETLSLLPESSRPPLKWIANSGNENYANSMRSLAEDLNVDFCIYDRIPDADLVQFLGRCRLLLYTSHLEPFGYAAVEAGACAVPVVAVAEGGVREIVVDGVSGLLLERNPGELAAAVGSVLNDENLAQQLGQSGAEIVAKRFSLPLATDVLLKNFESVRVSMGARGATGPRETLRRKRNEAALP